MQRYTFFCVYEKKFLTLHAINVYTLLINNEHT